MRPRVCNERQDILSGVSSRADLFCWCKGPPGTIARPTRSPVALSSRPVSMLSSSSRESMVSETSVRSGVSRSSCPRFVVPLM
ncbi:hypothetical protein RSAG8_13299, partial [Rhizoctonia solani AG-8 WAC10335]